MKRFAVLLLLAACTKEQPVSTGTMDMREPVAIRYVGAPELPVRAEANEQAEVLATYQNGEAISILSDKGEWVEVRTGDRAGWARAADLTTAEGKKAEEDNPTPKFRVMPLPVSAPSARGEIYLEADVNSEGEVLSIRTITNTTGSEALAIQNTNALRRARFFPIVQDGQKKPFKYYHRVTY
ncbi:MAG TPA: SH3 domain-containing protein [Thermoanaerobaculia bacterium]|nr:SH3 domain-containing protein [Thermoanaerobaculia bacterium]